MTHAREGSFVDNMRLPVHRWFRYSAGFSAAWAQDWLAERARGGAARVLDPFAGSGTTLLAADAAGLESVGLEAHPFVRRVARAKLEARVPPEALLARTAAWIEVARERSSPEDAAPDLVARCFSQDSLSRLERLRATHLDTSTPGQPLAELEWLALTSILRPCASVGTAQWQYVLPNRAKARSREPFAALEERARQFAEDLAVRPEPRARMIAGDARRDLDASLGSFDLVLTSPPYPNNFDYADATRLEMTFWREIERWADLQGAVRHRLVRSCSQHSAAEGLALDALLEEPIVAPIRDPLARVCRALASARLERRGRKTYDTMVAAYFVDLARVLAALRARTHERSELCLVIGDSAPYGVHVPVDAWLARLATAAGFGPSRFERLRDRNTRWKNRKHRVPLKEGRLVLRG